MGVLFGSETDGEPSPSVDGGGAVQRAVCDMGECAATVSRPGGRGPAASAAGLRKVGAPQGRVLANGQSG